MKLDSDDPDCPNCQPVHWNLKIDCPEAAKAPPSGVHQHQSDDLRWILLTTDEAERDPSLLDPITGKYLFFSNDLPALLHLAHAELLEHGFHEAKVPASPNPDGEYVLCLYSEDGDRAGELRGRMADQYAASDIRIPPRRFWKTDADTAAGVYSEQFLRLRERHQKPEPPSRRS